MYKRLLVPRFRAVLLNASLRRLFTTLPISAFLLLHFIYTQTLVLSNIVYVDNQLLFNCNRRNYSIADRSCTGIDGDAYTTVHAAVDAISPGEIILVRGGTYMENVVQSRHPVRSSSFSFYKKLTVRGFGAEKAILTYDPRNLPLEDTDKGPIVKILGDNVTIDRLTIVGTYYLGDNKTQDTDIDILVNGSYATISNNVIVAFGHSGIKGSAPGLIIEHNDIGYGGFTSRDHGIYSSDQSTVPKVILHNNLHHISGYGIHIFGYGRYYEIYDNLIHENGEGGIVITGDHIEILNNTIYRNGEKSVSQWGGQGGLNFFHYGLFRIRVENNIVWKNFGSDINCQPDIGNLGGNNFSNNIIGTGISNCDKYNNVNFWSNGRGTYTISSDPEFVDAGDGDFHLQSDSPAIDTGKDVGLKEDYDGTRIPQGDGYDLGAFEYVPIEPSAILDHAAFGWTRVKPETVVRIGQG